MTTRWIVLLLCALLPACVTEPVAVPRNDPSEDELRTRCAEHEAARWFDTELFSELLTHESPGLRATAARALGRMRDPRAEALLVVSAMVPGEDPAVLEEIAFALGQLGGGGAAAEPLALLARHAAPEVRARAVEALGRLAREADSAAKAAILPSLDDANPTVRGQALLALWRRNVVNTIPAIASHLRPDEDPEVRWRAAYALMRLESPAKHAALRQALGDPHPLVRTFAAWGLRNPCDPDAVEPLGRLLADPAAPWTARVQACMTLQACIEKGAGDRAAITAHLLAPRKANALEAVAELDALGAAGGESAKAVVESWIGDKRSVSARRAALVAYGKLAGEPELPLDRVANMTTVIGRFLGDVADPWTRAAAATALGHVPGAAAKSLLRRAFDPKYEVDGRVRAAAAEALLGDAEPDSAEWKEVLAAVYADEAVMVRDAAVSALIARKPTSWREDLVHVYELSGAHDHWELRQTILGALAAEEPRIPRMLLARALKDSEAPVRRTARELAVKQPDGADLVQANLQTEQAQPACPFDPAACARIPERLVLETSKGRLVIRLDFENAPRHVAAIAGLAAKGFYDGLTFHRVVPSFVVQGGDPLGNGWGDAGWFLPDEIHSAPFVRGTVGMPKAAIDDGSCQIFITHLPTPHLDGRYTVFGQTIEGLDLLDQIEVGDRILSATVEFRAEESAP